MHAIILAGGLGTRLRSVVADVPKPMAPINDQPFLYYLLGQLRSAGFVEVVLSVGYMADAIERHFGDGAELGMRLRYSVEAEPLGTGGALKLAESLIVGSDFLVLNGDSFFDMPLGELIAAQLRPPRALATLALARVGDGRRYGNVEIDSDGAVVSFVEKAIGGSANGLVNAGVYSVSRQLLDLIPWARRVSLETEVLPAIVGQGLRGVPFDGAFIDIGVPDDYARLARDWRSLFGPTLGGTVASE